MAAERLAVSDLRNIFFEDSLVTIESAAQLVEIVLSDSLVRLYFLSEIRVFVVDVEFCIPQRRR